jgi:hypothetical protein
MYLFLLERHKRGKREQELTHLISDMELGVLWEDGGSTDPAMEWDWWEAVQRIQQGFNPYTDSSWLLPSRPASAQTSRCY